MKRLIPLILIAGGCSTLSLRGQTTFLSHNIHTAVAAPSTPSAGLGGCYIDSTTKKWACKDDAGTISNTVVASAAVSNQFLTAISTAGVISRAQPAFTDLSGAATDAQVPNTITVDLATVATTANAGDSATAFFSAGTVEAARLPNLNTIASGLTASRCVETNGSGLLTVAAAVCGSGGGGNVSTTADATFGAFNYDFSGAASVSLPSPWVSKAVANTYTAGATQTLVPSASLFGAILSAGTPSAVTGGGIFMSNTSEFGWANGTAKIKFTNPATADRTVTLPDANSTTVVADTGASNNFLSAISAAGVISKAQPAFSNLSGLVAAAQNTVTVLDGSVAYCADAGSTDTYACSLSPAPGGYVTGARYRFKANTLNTGAASINLNSLGAKTIVKVAGGITTALATNDILAGQVVELTYDGTNMQMTSMLGNAAGGGNPVTADLLFTPDGTYDIGEAGGNRPGNIFLSGSVTGGGNFNALAFNISGNSQLYSPATGVLRLTDTGGSSFVRLTFGDTTASFPALKRSTTTLQARLADDSADTTLRMSKLTTETNCTDSAGAAACSSASAGSVVIDASATTVVVSTTAVSADSQIFVMFDSSLGTRLSVTCNTTAALPTVSARTAATSFTITVAVAPITNPACYSYHVVN